MMDSEQLAQIQKEHAINMEIQKRKDKFQKNANAKIWVEQSKLKLKEMDVDNMFI